jgi:hypothetical protein
MSTQPFRISSGAIPGRPEVTPAASQGVTLDFSKAQPIAQSQPVTLDFSKAQPIGPSMGAAPMSKLTEAQNLTQEGRAEHPVEAAVGEGRTRGLRSFSLRLMSLTSSVLDASHPSRPSEILF